MFLNREDAAHRLAAQLQKQHLHDPLVLAIPRGGMVTGAVLARELGAELDVLLIGKLRVTGQPDLLLGAVAPDGTVTLAPHAALLLDTYGAYLDRECEVQHVEMARRNKLFRAVRAPAKLTDRTVIVADDGIASGSSMIAALRWVHQQQPRELIAVAPIIAGDHLEDLQTYCNQVVALVTPAEFHGIAAAYSDFRTITDAEAVGLLQNHVAPVPAGTLN